MSKIQVHENKTIKIVQVDDHLEEDSNPSQLYPDKRPISQNFPHLIDVNYGDENNLSLDNSFLQENNPSQMTLQSQFQQPQHIELVMFQSQKQKNYLEQQNSMLISQLQVNMTNSYNRYFEACTEKLKYIQLPVDNCLSQINNKIKKQIRKGNIQISQNVKDLSKKKDYQAEQNERRMMKKLQIKKQEIVKKLKEIQNQEASLAHQLSSRHITTNKYIINQKQDQRMANILKIQKQFELTLQQRKNAQAKRLQQNLKKEKEKKQMDKQIELSQKKQKIAKKLKQINQRVKERQQIQLKLKIKQKVDDNNKNIKKIKEKNSLQISDKKQHKFNKGEYSNQLKIYQKYSQQKLVRSAKLIKSRHIQFAAIEELPKRQKTIFDKLVQEQKNQFNKKNKDQLQKIKQHKYKQKMSQYQQKILKQFKPKVDPSKAIIILPRSFSQHILTKQQRTAKGLEYLQRAKQLKRSQSNTQPTLIEPNTVFGYKQYKDYMQQMERKKYDPIQKQFKLLTKDKKDIQNYNNLMKAKFLAEGMTQKIKKSGDDKLYYSIQTKLTLLEKLY